MTVFDDSPSRLECALDENGDAPAIVLLFREDRVGLTELDARPSDWDVFEDLLECVAWGEDVPRSRHNYLRDGLWELKVGSLRSTFYDTDGVGGYVPKAGRRVWDIGQGDRRVYDPDEMDPQLRLGHWFVKTSQKTLPVDLHEADRIRMEDLRHDRGTEDVTPAVEPTDPRALP